MFYRFCSLQIMSMRAVLISLIRFFHSGNAWSENRILTNQTCSPFCVIFQVLCYFTELISVCHSDKCCGCILQWRYSQQVYQTFTKKARSSLVYWQTDNHSKSTWKFTILQFINFITQLQNSVLTNFSIKRIISIHFKVSCMKACHSQLNFLLLKPFPQKQQLFFRCHL